MPIFTDADAAKLYNLQAKIDNNIASENNIHDAISLRMKQRTYLKSKLYEKFQRM